MDRVLLNLALEVVFACILAWAIAVTDGERTRPSRGGSRAESSPDDLWRIFPNMDFLRPALMEASRGNQNPVAQPAVRGPHAGPPQHSAGPERYACSDV